MKVLLLILLTVISLTVNCQTYYIVRHAEKAQATLGKEMATPNDPPLTKQGTERALALKDLLKNKHIRFIFSTKTLRTLSTAQPLSDALHIKPAIYDTVNLAFINRLTALKGNTLIVGHSNTVDDIANELSKANNVKGDLADNQFDNLFIVTIKGKKISFRATKYGKPSE